MKIKYFLLLNTLLFAFQGQAITRFHQDQLQFTLVENDGTSVVCKHEPLKNNSPAPAPPWWSISCGDRQYVVDIWMDEYVAKGDLWTLKLLYHVKEGTRSSGEKLVQFKNHFTGFRFYKEQRPHSISSAMDVRNGLADLSVEVSL